MNDTTTEALTGELQTADVQELQTLHGLIAETQGYLRQAVACHYEVGVRLTEIRKQAPHGQWSEILQRDFAGMPASTAAGYMLFARKCEQLPKLRDFAGRNFSAAMTLLHGLEDDELQLLEHDQHPELALEDLDRMSVRQLKTELRKHRHDAEGVVKEETKTLQAEVDALVEERDTLQAQLGERSTPDVLVKQVRKVRDAAQRLSELVDDLSHMPLDELGHRHRAEVEANLHAASQTAALVYEHWLTTSRGEGSEA